MGLTIFYLSLAAWIIGAIVATPAQLRRRMETGVVCKWCAKPKTDYPLTNHGECGPHYANFKWVKRGEARARNTGDAWASFAFMLLWPALAAYKLGKGFVFLLGKPMLAATRYTPSELRRIDAEQKARISKQQKEIARLTREINGEGEDEVGYLLRNLREKREAY